MFDLYITQDFSHKPRDVNFSCRLSVLTRSLSLFLPSTSGNHVNIFGYLDRFMVPSKLPQRLFLWFSKEGDESLFSFSPEGWNVSGSCLSVCRRECWRYKQPSVHQCGYTYAEQTKREKVVLQRQGQPQVTPTPFRGRCVVPISFPTN